MIKRVKVGRLFRYLTERALMRLHYFFIRKEVLKISEFNSQQVVLNISDLEQFYLYKGIVREPENILLFEIISKSGLAHDFVDVGANYGHLAKTISGFYQKLILIDANPSATKFLNILFANSSKHKIFNKAIVQNPVEKYIVKLNVPVNSSGLGTVAKDSSFLAVTDQVVSFEVKTDSLSNIIEQAGLKGAFIKVDVEGMELEVLNSAGVYLNSDTFVFGFEALSLEDAKKVSKVFNNHTFYFARFSFVNDSGALSSSLMKILCAILSKGYIEIFKVDNFNNLNIDNYSQIIAVPKNLVDKFESGIEKVLSEKDFKYNLI